MGKHQKIEFLTQKEFRQLTKDGKTFVGSGRWYLVGREELRFKRSSEMEELVNRRFGGKTGVNGYTGRVYATVIPPTPGFLHGGYEKLSRIGFYLIE